MNKQKIVMEKMYNNKHHSQYESSNYNSDMDFSDMDFSDMMSKFMNKKQESGYESKYGNSYGSNYDSSEKHSLDKVMERMMKEQVQESMMQYKMKANNPFSGDQSSYREKMTALLRRHKRAATGEDSAVNLPGTLDLGDRLAEKIEEQQKQMEAKVGNMTCVLREIGILNADNELDFESEKRILEKFDLPEDAGHVTDLGLHLLLLLLDLLCEPVSEVEGAGQVAGGILTGGGTLVSPQQGGHLLPVGALVSAEGVVCLHLVLHHGLLDLLLHHALHNLVQAVAAVVVAAVGVSVLALITGLLLLVHELAHHVAEVHVAKVHFAVVVAALVLAVMLVIVHLLHYDLLHHLLQPGLLLG